MVYRDGICVRRIVREVGAHNEKIIGSAIRPQNPGNTLARLRILRPEENGDNAKRLFEIELQKWIEKNFWQQELKKKNKKNRLSKTI